MRGGRAGLGERLVLLALSGCCLIVQAVERGFLGRVIHSFPLGFAALAAEVDSLSHVVSARPTACIFA